MCIIWIQRAIFSLLHAQAPSGLHVMRKTAENRCDWGNLGALINVKTLKGKT